MNSPVMTLGFICLDVGKYWIQTNFITNRQFVPTVGKIEQLMRSDVIVGVEYDEGRHVVNV